MLGDLKDEPAERGAHGASTPLWYYVLCEAERKAGGEQLGPVGGRIVAEVLVGLLAADPRSYLRVEPPGGRPWPRRSPASRQTSPSPT